MGPRLNSDVDTWPLVGRGRELSALTAALTSGRGAVITGPAGVGKTTLAMAGLQLAEERGLAVARSTATHASRGLPFGALASILPPDPADDRVSRDDPGQLLRRYAREVAAGASGRAMVVFVDDAHLLDNGSATLIHQLVLNRTATVLVTVRSGEAAPDPVVALWKDGPAERIEVGVLRPAAIEELLASVLGGPVDAASLGQLAHHAQGNPMVLRELVSGALETGTLADDGGIWRLRGALRPTARLVELVALRLGDLSGPEHAVLEPLALGEPLELGRAGPAGQSRGGRQFRAQRPDLQPDGRPPGPGVAGSPGLRRRGPGRPQRAARAGHLPVAGRGDRVGRRAAPGRRPAAGLAPAGGRRRQRRAADRRGQRRAGPARPSAGRTAGRAAIEEGDGEGGGFEARFVAAEAAHFQGLGQAEDELAALAAAAATDAERASVALLRFDNAFFLRGRTDLRLIDDVAGSITDPVWRGELVSRRLFVRGVNSGPRAAVAAGSPLVHPSSSALAPNR